MRAALQHPSSNSNIFKEHFKAFPAANISGKSHIISIYTLKMIISHHHIKEVVIVQFKKCFMMKKKTEHDLSLHFFPVKQQ